MLSIPERLKSVSHPLIASVYVKKEFDQRLQPDDVLVIEACLPDPDDDYEMFDSYLMDLLIDLEDLKNQAEIQAGSFSRVDIRT